MFSTILSPFDKYRNRRSIDIGIDSVETAKFTDFWKICKNRLKIIFNDF